VDLPGETAFAPRAVLRTRRDGLGMPHRGRLRVRQGGELGGAHDGRVWECPTEVVGGGARGGGGGGGETEMP